MGKATRNIIVIGASAGGIPALLELVKTFSKDLKASIFIVLHLAPYSPSSLPEILSKAGPLKARHAKDGEKVEEGRIYVAPPDFHMLLEGDRVIVRKGPKENRFRPSIDALFRSAAYVYGPRVVGVILSGMLDDGTSGLWSVKRLGGIAIIQEPDEAAYPDMPLNVLEYVKVDHTVPVSEMARLIEYFGSEHAPAIPILPEEDMKLLKMEIQISTRDNAFEMGIMDMGQLTAFACPDCHGALTKLKEGNILRYRCHTGQAFTASALLAGITKTVEDNLWEAMRGLEENTMLLTNMAEHFKKGGFKDASKIFLKKAKETEDRARVIHDSVFRVERMSEDIRHKEKQ